MLHIVQPFQVKFAFSVVFRKVDVQVTFFRSKQPFGPKCNRERRKRKGFQEIEYLESAGPVFSRDVYAFYVL